MAQRRQRVVAWVIACVSVFFLFATFYTFFFSPPRGFHLRNIVTVESKAGLNEIADSLKKADVIRSPFWFRILVIISAGEKGVRAGDYLFIKSTGLFGVTSRLTNGNFGLTPVRLTFPEGMTAKQMSLMLADKLIGFDQKEFVKLSKDKEGYLFPDTYLFAPNTKPDEVIRVMSKNFDDKMKSFDASFVSFGKSLKDTVSMASILEAEARTTETRKIIAGILWKRLAMGMPLQIDAPFQYIIGKNTFQLTLADLKYDSPYNTYKYKGLPPGAIGNPGLDSLLSAVTPTKSPYLFYLSDIRGNMHYAKTFDEHVINKELYLK